MKFKEYMKHDQDVQTMLEWAIFIEDYSDSDKLDEGVVDSIKSIKSKMAPLLKKAGIHVSQGDGLIQYFWKTNKNIARLIYHGFRAFHYNDEESKKRIKEIMKSVKKEDLMDVLLKLDQVTLHMLTGPLHVIDALTGTHIMPDLNRKTLPAIERAKAAIKTLEQAKNNLTGKMKAQLQKYLNALRRIFTIGDFQKA